MATIYKKKGWHKDVLTSNREHKRKRTINVYERIEDTGVVTRVECQSQSGGEFLWKLMRAKCKVVPTWLDDGSKDEFETVLGLARRWVDRCSTEGSSWNAIKPDAYMEMVFTPSRPPVCVECEAKLPPYYHSKWQSPASVRKREKESAVRDRVVKKLTERLVDIVCESVPSRCRKALSDWSTDADASWRDPKTGYEAIIPMSADDLVEKCLERWGINKDESR